MNTKKVMRARRKLRIRAKIAGTATRPRLTIYRSLVALYTQVIDDEKSVTMAAARIKGKNREQAKTLGATIAQLVKKQGITTVIFDRSGYRYHGVIQAFADAAREEGIQF